MCIRIARCVTYFGTQEGGLLLYRYCRAVPLIVVPSLGVLKAVTVYRVSAFVGYLVLGLQTAYFEIGYTCDLLFVYADAWMCAI